MLLSVTPNPAIDRIVHVPTLMVGAVHRATRVDVLAGGKGLNVARAALTLQAEVLVTGPLGGHSGQTVAQLAREANLSANWYQLPAGNTRTCTLINHAAGDATVINEEGPHLTPQDWQQFAAHVAGLAQTAQVIAFCGSVPLGVDAAALGQLARRLADNGHTVFVDTSKAPLKAILANPAGLCLKVNRQELLDGLGVTADRATSTALAEFGKELLGRGTALLVITLGAGGALVVAGNGVWQITPPAIQVVSTVGSGDSMLAGLVVGRLRGYTASEAVALGVACGTANALSGLPGCFELGQVEALLPQVKIEQIADMQQA